MNVQRRQVLKGAGIAGAVGLALAAGLLKPGAVYAAEWNKAAFTSRDLAGALNGIGAVGAADSDQIMIKAPDLAENGTHVPVEIISTIAGTESIAIIAEKNGFPLIAEFGLMDGAQGYVSTRIKLGGTCHVRAVVKSGGKVYTASKLVDVRAGGCDTPTDSSSSPEGRPMSGMRIRASMSGDVADVRCLLNHVMETGLRKVPKTEEIIPAHHITNLVVTVGGKTVMDAQLGGGIAKDPYLGLKVKGAKAGDVVTVSWVDNKGEKMTGEAIIS